jgi:mono/diheme cytochrome c family protein
MILRNRAAAVILLATSLTGTGFAEERGAAIFKAKCMSCHDANGLATTPVAKSSNMRSFKAPDILNWTDAQFIAFITTAYKNKGMTDAQIKDVVAYIHTLQKR